MKEFDPKELKQLYKPKENSSGEDNGQVTIIGGSKLFHGAPLYGLKIASRIAGMVFFASPEPTVGKVAERIKSNLFSFVWTPWEDLEFYIKKSDATLIGPGFMRFGSEKVKEKDRSSGRHLEGRVSKEITETLLDKFPNQKWVIDAGSLQTINPKFIPKGSIITPNSNEFCSLFGIDKARLQLMGMEEKCDLVLFKAKENKCTIVLKGSNTLVSDGKEIVTIGGGNPGLNKGGTGDCLAGLTLALFAKNPAFLSACAANYVSKRAAEMLFENVGVNYNADDLAGKIPEVLHSLTK